MEKIRKIIFMLAIAMLAAGCAGSPQEQDGLLLSESGAISREGFGQESEDTGNHGVDAQDFGGETPLIYVQVSGAVKHPGVYELPEGSRVFQAVELAGGLAAKADQKSLNQAEILADGQMIWVMTKEEAAAQTEPQPEGQEPQDSRVNLNTATKEELMALPGIGEAKAGLILAWRETHGGFAQIEDLMKIEGIKEGVFSKIEDCVRVQ